MSEELRAMSSRPRIQVAGSRHGRWQFRAVDLGVVVSSVGTRLFAACMKCFVGVDRLMTFEQMLVFNVRELKLESIAYNRNLRVLVMMLAGTLHELGDALHELNAALTLRKLGDLPSWKPLNDRRRLWTGNAALRKARNQMAHHLGDSALYDGALNALAAASPAEDCIYHCDGTKRQDGETELGWALLLRGLDIPEEQLRALLEITQTGHEDIPDLMAVFFGDVLDRCGVEIENRMEASPT
jgi:hypothetical protein